MFGRKGEEAARLEDSTRLALLQERLTVFLEAAKESETENKAFRHQTTTNLNELGKTMGKLGDAQTDVVESVTQLRKEVDAARFLPQMAGVWKVLVALIAVLSALGGAIATLRALKVIP